LRKINALEHQHGARQRRVEEHFDADVAARRVIKCRSASNAFRPILAGLRNQPDEKAVGNCAASATGRELPRPAASRVCQRSNSPGAVPRFLIVEEKEGIGVVPPFAASTSSRRRTGKDRLP